MTKPVLAEPSCRVRTTPPLGPTSHPGSRLLCFVFDLDDTLFLERSYIRSGFAAVGRWTHRTLGVAGFARIAWEVFEAGCRHTVFDKSLIRCGVVPTRQRVARMVRIYRRHRPEIRLAPDAKRCLEFFRARAALGLISDGPLASQCRKVEALGLSELMSPIVLTARWGRAFGKPHPRAFEYVASCLGNSPGRLVYVGDNPAKDFLAPRALGWETVRVRRAGGLYHYYRSSRAAAARWEIDSLDELTDLAAVIARG